MLYTVVPTIDTDAYTAGDIVGSRITIPDSNPGLLHMLTLFDKDGQKAAYDFFIFRGTISDNYDDDAAFAINSADEALILGVESLLSSDYVDVGSDAMATAKPIGINIPSGGLTVVAVTRGTPTYSTTSGLRFVFGILEGI